MVHEASLQPDRRRTDPLGLSLAGSRVLEVRGRKSGEWRRTPVNPLEFEGRRYIVAPRGETQWKWAWEVGAFFQGVGAEAPDEELRRIAPRHPVFRISRRS
jgi:hypothetical protein